MIHPSRYRKPDETWILLVSLAAVVFLALLAAGPTLCLAPILFIVILVMAYQSNQAHHQELLRVGIEVTRQQAPGLSTLSEDCQRVLNPGPLDLIVIPSRQLNAYTFGLQAPHAVVLFSPLLKVMDADELRFIIGHEMGHIALGHTWLNTLIGGMAGVPKSFGGAVVLTLAFRSWNRACEYSADRAGLLACGSLNKSISTLVKLVASDADTPAEQAAALRVIDMEDDSIGNILAETLATHPMTIRRVNQLRQFVSSRDYQQCLIEKRQ
jgi:Zn-dependent protease with chaperone function